MFTISSGAWALLALGAIDSSGNAIALSALSASVDSTTDAYITKDPATGQLAIVPRSAVGGPPLTSDVTLNITAAGKNEAGQDLAPLLVQVVLKAPAPPVTDQLVVTGFNVQTGGTIPADSGSNTVVLLP